MSFYTMHSIYILKSSIINIGTSLQYLAYQFSRIHTYYNLKKKLKIITANLAICSCVTLCVGTFLLNISLVGGIDACERPLVTDELN